MGAARPFQQKLLPYERQLIAALGISEKEYAALCEDIIARAGKRHSAYAKIPDIRCEPISITAVLINVAVGAVLTGVGMLLAPKPGQQEQRKIKQGAAVNLGSQTGRERFNSSIGFDTLPQLAELGSPIPIVWGRYKSGPKDNSRDDLEDTNPNPDEASGGILAEPLTVFSRVTSQGSYQTLHLIAVVGDGPVNPPELRGIMLGGQPMNSIYRSSYGVYWLEGKGTQQFSNNDLIFGEPETNNNNLPFGVPTSESEIETQSCMAFTPSSNTSFGVYQSFANIGQFKLNWELIPFPRLVGQSDNNKNAKSNARMKIAGVEGMDQDQGMRGTGRIYNRMHGLRQVLNPNGSIKHDPVYSEEVEVKIDDIVVVQIRAKKLEEKYYHAGKDGTHPEYEDLIATIDRMRFALDDSLIDGSVWLCHQTLMRVERPPGENPLLINKEDKFIRLRVIDFIGPSKKIGLGGQAYLTGKPEGGYKNVKRESFPYVVYEGGESSADPRIVRNSSWYPLQKVDLGVVKNTKACDVTEIGIKSQVWGRVNGLCNFPSLPSPDNLIDMETDVEDDENGDVVNNGYNNLYFERTSFFYLAIKNLTEGEKGVKESGDEKSFKDDLFGGFDIIDDIVFCVTGRAPVDQYNFIRIIHGGVAPTQLEFRLIPIPAINVYFFQERDKPFYRLDAEGKLFTKSVESAKYNSRYTINFRAREIILSMVEDSPYFGNEQSTKENTELPGRLTVSGVVIDHTDENRDAEDKISKKMTWMSQYFGPTRPVVPRPRTFEGKTFNRDKTVFGETHTYTRRLTSTDGKYEIEVEGRCTLQDVRDYTDNHDSWWDKYEDFKIWHAPTWKFKRIIRGEQLITQLPFSFKVRAEFGKDYFWGKKNNHGSPGMKVTLTGRYEDLPDIIEVKKYKRLFDIATGYQEVYAHQEVTTSSDSNPEHSISYVNEIVSNLTKPNYGNLAMIGIKLRALNQTQSLTQMQVWLREGVKASKLLNGAKNETSANLAELMHYLLTQPGRGLYEEVHPLLVDTEQFKITAEYLKKLKLRFDGAISDAVSYREYFAAIAPYFMCHLTTNNGKFSLVPALPYNKETGNVVTGRITPAAIFNNGNIVEGSFKLEYFPLIDRRDIRAIVKYRSNRKYSLTDVLSFQIQYKTSSDRNLWKTPIQQEFDLTTFCSKGAQAQLVGRYMLSTRRRIDHQITFKTSPLGLNLAPGDFIQLLDTQLAALQTQANIAVLDDGSLLTAMPVADGTYEAYVYRKGSIEVTEETITIMEGVVTDTTLIGSLINMPNIQERYGFYQIVQITLDSDFMVEIRAAHHPVNENFESKIVKDVLVDPNPRFSLNGRP